MKKLLVLFNLLVFILILVSLSFYCYAIPPNPSECTVSNDKNLIQFERVKELHKQMYWAREWSDEKIHKNIDNSTLCYSIFDKDGNQIGFVRAVTDFSTICYILDLVVDESCRRVGIGTKLMKAILDNEDLKDCSFVLAPSVEARNFYEHLGFIIKNDKYMLFRV